MYEFANWDNDREVWSYVGRQLGIQRRDLPDSEVATIRERLPFGPPNPDLVIDLSRELGLFPITVFRIWAGDTFKRPKAFPEGHPMKLNINAKNASNQRLRQQAQKHREAVGELQEWKCKYCHCDIAGRGKSALDHINPIAKGGTSDPGNLQLLCRRCNIRKSAHIPSDLLTSYMDKKVHQDRAIETCNEIIPPIVDSLIWADTTDTTCPWCETTPKIIQRRTGDPGSTVFQCPNCQRLFRSGGFQSSEDFYTDLHYAIRGICYAPEYARSIIESVMTGDLATVANLIREWAGHLEEVQRRRHRHRRGDTWWCEFGDDDYKVLNVYLQTNPVQLMP